MPGLELSAFNSWLPGPYRGEGQSSELGTAGNLFVTCGTFQIIQPALGPLSCVLSAFQYPQVTAGLLHIHRIGSI